VDYEIYGAGAARPVDPVPPAASVHCLQRRVGLLSLFAARRRHAHVVSKGDVELTPQPCPQDRPVDPPRARVLHVHRAPPSFSPGRASLERLLTCTTLFPRSWRIWIISGKSNYVFPGILAVCELSAFGIALYMIYEASQRTLFREFGEVRGAPWAWLALGLLVGASSSRTVLLSLLAARAAPLTLSPRADILITFVVVVSHHPLSSADDDALAAARRSTTSSSSRAGTARRSRTPSCTRP